MFLVFRLILYTRIQVAWDFKHTFTPSFLKCTEGSRSCAVCKLDERNTGLMLYIDYQSCRDFCVRHRVAISYGAHSASYLMAVEVTSAEGKDNVELYNNSPDSIEVCS